MPQFKWSAQKVWLKYSRIGHFVMETIVYALYLTLTMTMATAGQKQKIPMDVSLELWIYGDSSSEQHCGQRIEIVIAHLQTMQSKKARREQFIFTLAIYM